MTDYSWKNWLPRWGVAGSDGYCWRALCAELLQAIEDDVIDVNNGQRFQAVIARAEAALAQPEPQEVTDEELDELSHDYWWLDANHSKPWRSFARTVLDRWGRPAIKPDGPAVPNGREPASVAYQPTDQELLELMPETMRDEFSYAAKTCSDATGGRVEPGIFRVALNTAALEYAQVVLQRYARPAIEPVPIAERLPEPHTKVIVHYLNCLGKSRTILAEWVPAKSLANDCLINDDFAEYDEEDDEYYWPEGWYELIENWDDYGAVFVSRGEITHWQPLPINPHHALPVPQQEAE